MNLRYENWNWEIIPKNKELDKNFYDEAHTFLFLIGIKLEKKGSKIHKEVISDQLPQVALIPGKVVVKYFTEESPNSRAITLSLKKLLEKKYPYWNDYFGEKNIYKTLTDNWKKQEEEEKLLERERSQKKP
jgi:hypothetical protein